MRSLQALTLVTILVGAPVAAQAPAGISGAPIEVVIPDPGIESALGAAAREAGITWVGWEVDSVPGHDGACCYRDGDHTLRGCSLEDRSGSIFTGGIDRERSATDTMRVLVRLEGGRATRVQPYAASCPLDASGADRLVWLRDAGSEDSVATLAAAVEGVGTNRLAGERVRKGALAAIAMHAGRSAFAHLARWARGGPGEIREESIFWLGAGRGAQAVPLLTELATGDAGDEIRERAIFALHVTDTAEAVDVLIGIARGDRSPDARGRALFWLAQSAGERATATLRGAIEDDPDEEVKRQAVFALSQLPPDRGVPLLIRIARTHELPSVRKQAIFWLGQSGDPRAFDFIVGLLER